MAVLPVDARGVGHLVGHLAGDESGDVVGTASADRGRDTALSTRTGSGAQLVGPVQREQRDPDTGQRLGSTGLAVDDAHGGADHRYITSGLTPERVATWLLARW